MLQLPTPQFRRRRERQIKASPTPPGPAALMLAGATYDHTVPAVTLVFDRPINIDALDGSAILLEDAQENFFKYDGQGGSELLGPATLKLTLIPIDDAAGTGVRLSASAASGIVAVDDGGTWAGVTELALPFP